MNRAKPVDVLDVIGENQCYEDRLGSL